LRRKLVFVGIVFLIIASLTLVSLLWQMPFQEQEASDFPQSSEQEPYDVPHSSVVLSETFVVPGGGETVRPINLTIWDQLHIHFRSTTEAYGHLGHINFLILDETNYLKRKAEEPYDKLVYLSQFAKYDQYCLITHNGTWYFIWDNSFRSSSSSPIPSQKEVSTTITRNWNETAYRDITVYHTIVPSAYSTYVEYLGIALIAVSVVAIPWGIVSKEKRDEIEY
jgi:hypothetical protein